MTHETDILIAGGGVAGLTAAAAFGSLGLRVLLVDPTPPVTVATQPGADDGGHRRAMGCRETEVRVVRVHRSGIAVVGVHDRQTEALLECAAHVETPPLGHREVGGTLRRDDAVGRGRTRRVEAHRAYPAAVEPGDLQPVHEHRLERIDGRTGALGDRARQLDHVVDEERAAGIEHRDVVLRATVVDAHDDGRCVSHVVDAMRRSCQSATNRNVFARYSTNDGDTPSASSTSRGTGARRGAKAASACSRRG